MSRAFEALKKIAPPRPYSGVMQVPLLLESTYYGVLKREFISDIVQVGNDIVMPYVRLRVDADAGLVDRIKQALERLSQRFSTSFVGRRIRPIFEGVTRFQAAQLNQFLGRVLGIELPIVGSEAWLQRSLEEAVRENVDLIRSLPDTYFEQIAKTVQRVLTSGGGPEALAAALERSLGITDRRAAIVARDQTNKFYGTLNELRQKQLNVRNYIWRTQKDNRVRDGHIDREGRVFSWDRIPPDGGGGAGHPGQPINCRCWAEPIIVR